VGRLVDPFQADDEQRFRSALGWTWHQMGTTRMHEDPSQGVVDADTRLHGTSNVYVAGSSVFPTPGSDMPTLTIVALSLRLADHLVEALR
jgi:choline dehydrogenase-like flavoprotein